MICTSNSLKRLFEKDLRQLFLEQNKSLVIVDDDPTGTQTVFDVPVLGYWTEEAFTFEFQIKTPLFFVLANTRSLTEDQAVNRAKEIGQNLRKASLKTGRNFILVSRSDSTLRGHFPTEVDAIRKAAGMEDHPIILIPTFFEGGRITENNVHFILEDQNKIPVAETPFAKDRSFGYKNSDLRKWVEEKSKGIIKYETVKTLSINDILAGEKTIQHKLTSLKEQEIMIINSTTYKELEIFCLAIHRLIQEGKGFVFRTVASFVSAFAGIGTKVWKPDNSKKNQNMGGLIIIGSYVPKTTSQLHYLLQFDNFETIPLSVNKIINEEKNRIRNIKNLVINIEKYLIGGRHTVIYTSRELVSGANPTENLAIGEQVTEFLVGLISKIKNCPSFIIAKGGITSNDLAVRGLGMKRAKVLGQIIPGVPVWELGKECKFPSMPYIVFPGNVGDNQSLKRVLDLLTN